MYISKFVAIVIEGEEYNGIERDKVMEKKKNLYDKGGGKK